MAKVTGLGHVGLFVQNMERELWFFRDVLGLQVTDQNSEGTTYFMSARPQEEHHELVLIQRPDTTSSVQQVSFTCSSLADVKEFHRRFQENGIRFDRIVSHGNAIGIYVLDPDGNRVEVYWPTGLDHPQPFGIPVDLTKSDEEILAHLTGDPAPAAGVAMADRAP